MVAMFDGGWGLLTLVAYEKWLLSLLKKKNKKK
jgi:hypothetical protein